ncbi:MAG TPA: ABC transporter permease, partial [Gemmatimonadaceae bacterium]|nr:ABC transporter permease [Gemmatimonadaceae bacterium]
DDPGAATTMQTLGTDLRYAVRTLRRNLAFAALTAATLALGIGAATIVYSVVDGVVLDPFPYPEPGRLVGVGPEYPRLGRELSFWEVISPAEYLDIRAQSRTLERVVAWDMGNRQIAGESDAPERVFSAFWYGDAFPTLGVAPALGRGFSAQEVERGERVAVISHRLWLRRFGGDPGMVGRAVSVNGDPYTVVGVMPPRTLVYGTDLWLPMWATPEQVPRDARQFQVLGRLRAGATLAQANAELATIARRVEQAHGAEFKEYAGWRLVGRTWTDINVSMLRPAALVLLGAVGFVLLLVCVNVASLLLARSAGRRREVAVRSALGASRGRVVRQLLTESVVLALLGGALGAALALWGTTALAAFLQTLPLPIPGDVRLNPRVLAVAAGITVAAGILFGLAPALEVTRPDVQGALKSDGGGSIGSARRHRMQRVFVGVEVALALVLLAGGGLLVRSFLRLQRVDAGFDARGVLTMRLTLPREKYAPAAIAPFFQQLAERVGAVPGVRAVAFGSQFAPMTFQRAQLEIEGRDAAREGQLPVAFLTQTSDGYFRALGVPLRRGRVPDERDGDQAPPVAVINEEAARRLFPGQEPIGRRLRTSKTGRWFEVVGVVGTTRNAGLDRPPQPEVFSSVRQALGQNNQLFLLVRADPAAGDPRRLLPLVRREVRALDPDQPVYAVQTVEEAFATAAGPRRAATLTLTLFGLFALALAAVGIYGVVSYAVSERTREIGVRIALGARAGQVRRLMVRQAMLPVALGAAAGSAGAVALGRAMGGILFEVRGSDPLTLGSAVALLGAVALAASYLPARRASRLDPVAALRA